MPRPAFNPRRLFVHHKTLNAVLWLAAFVVGVSCLPFVSRGVGSQGRASAPGRELTLEARVAYQRAIEEVYWRHTLWPKENTRRKPTLDEVVPRAATRAKVENALRMSGALKQQWGVSLEGAALQREIERMAAQSRQPEVLHELWAALDNDPYVVAEMLARPIVADRLVREAYAFDRNLHATLRERAVEQLKQNSSVAGLKKMDGVYLVSAAVRAKTGDEAATAKSGDVTGDAASMTRARRLSDAEWNAEKERLREMFDVGAEAKNTGVAAEELPTGRVSGLQEDAERFYVVAALESTDESLQTATVEWRKTSFDEWWRTTHESFAVELSTGMETYRLAEISQADSCADDTWTPTKALPEATGTAVWTGTEMIIWGGGKQNSGARYNPATDTWTPTSTTNVPSHRSGHTAVWTGTEMIVWGGCERTFDFCGTNDGGRYNPVSDTWAGLSITNASSPRSRHIAVWTGSKMIIWAGIQHGYRNGGRAIFSGGIYDLASDSWTTMNTTNSPGGGSGFTAVWTGSEMIAWGGNTSVGGRYNPDTDTWTPTNPTNAPSPRTDHTTVWTGTEMIVWGGTSGSESFNTGGRYNPANDSWTPTSTTNAPSPRYLHTAVWTGTEMIVWGGNNPLPTNTGGRYNPSSDSWTPTSTTNAPPPKSGHVAVWTGELMIVWAVTENKTGGRYNPANDSWTPTDNNDSPPPINFGVWSGVEMLVWSQAAGCLSGCPGAGKRYDPATYSWRPMSNIGAPITPPADRPIAAVWTGTEMIVWGQNSGAYGSPGEGGRYNPLTDSWRPVTTNGAPVNRSYFTGVWTGSEMIVWGGQSNDGTLQNTGSRYNPSTDTWRPTNTAGAPQARYIHAAVWTGTEMIVWGGSASSPAHLNTGGRYNPSNDTWTPTSTSGAPEARRFHTAVWTGTEMIVWGGRIGDYNSSDGLFNTGGRYRPSTDTWTPTNTTVAPAPRFKHSAVWTGELMIVWGGISPNAVGYAVSSNTGGRYQPSTDAWTPTSTLRAPGRRHDHIAFWTGTGMIVWGGYTEDGSPSHGAIYCAPGSAAPANNPPNVNIDTPADGANSEAGANIHIEASADDSDGTITSVSFYADDTLLGTDSQAPYSFIWDNPGVGNYTLTARATDDDGSATTSAPVQITVNPPATILTNVAIGKTATQSSTYVSHNPAASRAVDGNTDGVFLNGSVTATNSDNQAWWQVDLGSSYSIDTIKLSNRTDCCGERLSNFYVFVSDAPFSSGSLASTQAQAGVSSYHTAGQAGTTLALDIHRTGRYVRVQLAGTNILSLAEVEVLSSQPPIPSPVNLALNRPAIQSSTYSSYNPVASRAVDGNTDGVFLNGSVTATNSDNQAWWQVDLGSAQPIDTIKLWNRTDCCGERLSNFYVFVSDVPFASTGLAATMNQAGVGSYHTAGQAGATLALDIHRTGRYVRIQLAGTNILSLPEVEVLSSQPPIPAPVNLALNRSAIQSSTYSSYNPAASRAVDGNTDGVFLNGSVTATNSDNQAWWQVDLGAVRPIDNITLWNRTDCCGERLSNFYVFVSDVPFASTGLAATQAQAGVSTFPTSGDAGAQKSIGVNRAGRYVRVQLAGTNILSLAEVEVWGMP